MLHILCILDNALIDKKVVEFLAINEFSYCLHTIKNFAEEVMAQAKGAK